MSSQRCIRFMYNLERKGKPRKPTQAAVAKAAAKPPLRQQKLSFDSPFAPPHRQALTAKRLWFQEHSGRLAEQSSSEGIGSINALRPVEWEKMSPEEKDEYAKKAQQKKESDSAQDKVYDAKRVAE